MGGGGVLPPCFPQEPDLPPPPPKTLCAAGLPLTAVD